MSSVVHLLAPAAYGGLESVVLTLAAGQAARGHDVTVIGTFADPPDGQPFWDVLQRIVDVRAVPLVLPGRQYLEERRAVRRILEEVRAEVLHTHGYRPDVLAAPVARAMGVGTVTTVHGFTGNGWKNRSYEWLQRRAYRRFDAVVAVSRKLGRELTVAGIPRGHIHCIPNAWAPVSEAMPKREARAALGLPHDARVVGWIGRMSPEKAPDQALKAFMALASDDAHLSFIGDGRMRAEVQTLAEAKGLDRRVHWHGVVPGAGRYLAAFDALLITSWTEGTPIVLLEAMAAGVPVVTTAVGGIPDAVSDREAVLVTAGDVKGLARGLDAILAGSPDALQRSVAARRRLEESHAVEPWVRRYDDVYQSCLTG